MDEEEDEDIFLELCTCTHLPAIVHETCTWQAMEKLIAKYEKSTSEIREICNNLEATLIDIADSECTSQLHKGRNSPKKPSPRRWLWVKIDDPPGLCKLGGGDAYRIRPGGQTAQSLRDRKGGRRCPTLPQGDPCSTIGAMRLDFRVRHGNG